MAADEVKLDGLSDSVIDYADAAVLRAPCMWEGVGRSWQILHHKWFGGFVQVRVSTGHGVAVMCVAQTTSASDFTHTVSARCSLEWTTPS